MALRLSYFLSRLRTLQNNYKLPLPPIFLHTCLLRDCISETNTTGIFVSCFQRAWGALMKTSFSIHGVCSSVASDWILWVLLQLWMSVMILTLNVSGLPCSPEDLVGFCWTEACFEWFNVAWAICICLVCKRGTRCRWYCIILLEFQSWY